MIIQQKKKVFLRGVLSALTKEDSRCSEAQNVKTFEKQQGWALKMRWVPQAERRAL
jgi:hypothetical protein